MGRTNRRLIEDDRWKKKFGAHMVKEPVPTICPRCEGVGVLKEQYFGPRVFNHFYCTYCDGTGEIDTEENL